MLSYVYACMPQSGTFSYNLPSSIDDTNADSVPTKRCRPIKNSRATASTHFSLMARHTQYWISLMLVIFLLLDAIDGTFAFEVPHVPQIPKSPTPQSIAAAIICMGIGIFLCFFGYKYFRVATFFGGFGLFAFLAYIGCINISPMTGKDDDDLRSTIYIIVIAAIGFIGGLLAVVFWRVGITVIGALAGLVITLFVLALAPNGLIQNNIGRALLIVGMVLICSFLVNRFQRPAIIVSTATAGAFSIGLGLDLVIGSQLAVSVAAFLAGGDQKPDAVYNADAKTYVVLGLIAIASIGGILVQFRFHKPDFTDDAPPQCRRGP
ncbi:hypothetical protein BDF19DRAFT_420337 [Syncephalis fuscata]|nr:hypothetical protein BDF19DRAFT_420337 [Syncephalis fuscata]